MKVIGIRRYSFPDKKDTSRMISGTIIYCVNPVDPDEGEGFAYNKKGSDTVSINDWTLKNILFGVLPCVGDEIRVSYNKEGKLQAIDVLNPAK